MWPSRKNPSDFGSSSVSIPSPMPSVRPARSSTQVLSRVPCGAPIRRLVTAWLRVIWVPAVVRLTAPVKLALVASWSSYPSAFEAAFHCSE